MTHTLANDAARVNPAISESIFVEAINTWTQTRRVADAITQQELAEMDGVQRLDGLRKTLIAGISLFYAQNPKADLAPGIYALITVLSDNNKGACTLGQGKIAKLLHAKIKSVSDATVRLDKAGLVVSVKGKASIRPVSPRAFFSGYNHVAWELAALLESVQLPGRNRDVPLPGRNRDVEATSRPQPGCDPIQLPGRNRDKFTKRSDSSVRAEAGNDSELASAPKKPLGLEEKKQVEQKKPSPPCSARPPLPVAAMARPAAAPVSPGAGNVDEMLAQVDALLAQHGVAVSEAELSHRDFQIRMPDIMMDIAITGMPKKEGILVAKIQALNMAMGKTSPKNSPTAWVRKVVRNTKLQMEAFAQETKELLRKLELKPQKTAREREMEEFDRMMAKY